MKREERYLHNTPRPDERAGLTSYKPDAPAAAAEKNINTNSTSGKFGLKSFLLSVLIVLTILFASAAPADAYYLSTYYPQNNHWVTNSPYTFYWHTNSYNGSPAYWGGSSAYWYYSILTIYNHTWGYRNNDSWFYQPGLMGWGGYSQTLTESPLGSSYWRMRGYYQYSYGYWSYEYWYSYWVYHYVLRCGWWSKGSCMFYYWSWEPWYIQHVYHYVWRTAYTYAYTGYTGWSYFGVDLYAPVVTLTSPADGYSFCNNTSVSFLFSATDSMSGINTSSTYSYIEIRQGSTGGAQVGKYAIAAGNNTINHTFTTSGTYYWRVVATDRATPAAYSSAGARTTSSPWRSLTIDNAPPTTPALSSPVGNAWLTSTSVSFGWTGSTDAGTGVKGYYLKINKPDGSAYPGYGGTYGGWLGNVTSRTVNGMPETPTGNYSWWVYAEDNCNNKSLVSTGDGRFRIDASVPQISITDPQAAPYWYNEYTAGSINFTATFTDSVSGVYQTRLLIYRPGPVLMATYGWYNYAAYTASTTINTARDCKTGAYNGVWRATYDVRDHALLTATQNRDFQVDVTRPTAGTIQTVDGVSVTANPIPTPYPIVKVDRPVITWTASSDPAPQSGIANYFVKIWNSSGTLVASATLGSGTFSYQAPTLSTGLYYFEVGVTDRAKNGDVQNVDGIAGNNQRFYTTQDTTYTNKRRFIVDLDAPVVTGYNPPLPKSGNGSAEWVVSANPSYSGQMYDTYGIYNYHLRVYRKTGATYTYMNVYNSASPITTNSSTHIIPNVPITTLTDGFYGFEIQAWDNGTTTRTSTIAPSTHATLKYDFKVDITPPIKGAATQPLNDVWIVKPTHANPKRPTFLFSAANDNQSGTNDDASYSGVKEYMVRIWWDPTFPGVTSYPEAPFLGQPYKDYYIGTATTWTIPEDLKNGRYYWDVWVKDNANNWCWYYNATTGNYTTTSVYGNTAMPTASTYKFRVDTVEPITNTLVSNIGDVWITVFNPSFVWKASDDAVPGSGRNYYDLHLWGSAGGPEILIYRVPCSTAPGNTAAGGNVTLPYGGGTFVSGAWPPAAGGYLPNGRYYWDIKFVDIAGNYKWYKSGLVNQPTVYNLGESFRVDKIPPTTGGITYPINNEWIDQKGTRIIDVNTGDAIYTPNKKPSFKFKAAKDDESGLHKYIVVLKDARSPKVIIGDQALTPANTPSLFSLPFGTEFTFNPPWGTGTWPVELRDGKYFWEVIVIDNTKVNTSYYKSVNGNDANYETFRLDTIPPTLAVNKSEPIRAVAPATTGNVAAGIAVGELLSPAYGYITTISVNLINFQFSKAVDDINTGFSGFKLGNTSQLFSTEGPSGIHRYNFVIATTRDKLKEFANVDIWTSGYTIDTTAAVINFRTSIPADIDAELNALTVGSLYWSVHVIDKAGNEAQYVDRKMRIRHLPPGGGNLEAPPNGFTTTNRKPTFKWTK
jgi:hypothetical protein